MGLPFKSNQIRCYSYRGAQSEHDWKLSSGAFNLATKKAILQQIAPTSPKARAIRKGDQSQLEKKEGGKEKFKSKGRRAITFGKQPGSESEPGFGDGGRLTSIDLPEHGAA